MCDFPGAPNFRNQGQLPYRLKEDKARSAKKPGWLNKFGEQILRMLGSAPCIPFVPISWAKCEITHRGAVEW